MPARRDRVTGRGEHGDPRREGDPEAGRDHQHPQPGENREPCDDDDRDREDETDRHRSPPEVERLRPRVPEYEEAEDEPRVRRVEDMPSADTDDVLREQSRRGGGREDPGPVQAPPVAVLGAGDAQDEGDPVARQECARRPHERPLTPEHDHGLEHGARDHRDENLRDRELEAERRLAEHLERDDREREMEPRVGPPRQDDRIARTADQHRRPACAQGSARAHAPPIAAPGAVTGLTRSGVGCLS